ncbi:hypothetical protein WHR41_02078 [Cladosporium halotolerans]|uniref:Uncharacterized protein n=1 Tax=Cladosporium halotolerans TaxID=1052096 RepID=A0AB34KW08_9PEZI
MTNPNENHIYPILQEENKELPISSVQMLPLPKRLPGIDRIVERDVFHLAIAIVISIPIPIPIRTQISTCDRRWQWRRSLLLPRLTRRKHRPLSSSSSLP